MSHALRFPLRRIVVGTDCSAYSATAMRAARAYAEADGAELHIVHAIRKPTRLSALFSSVTHENDEKEVHAMADFEKSALDALQKHVSDVFKDTPAFLSKVTCFVDVGEPGACLVNRAEYLDADLVVVGHRGETNLENMLLGSVADRAVRYAKCSVLVARSEHTPMGVVAATDFSDPSMPALQTAAVLAGRYQTPVTFVHSVQTGAGFLHTITDPQQAALSPVLQNQQNWQANESNLAKIAEEIGQENKITVQHRTTSDDPAAAIVKTAEETNADLVVVATHGRTGLKRLTLGSVAARVIETAPCSVWTVRIGG